ncbi:MAG TPA: AAA family ATPase [Bradyrhizobium sp.]|nr:AAA family ATPase [Bradyrhizobium sp.]
MFEGYYGLTSLPFQLAPDSRFFFASRNHARALAHLTYGLSQGDGFLVVTGEVGAGKTTLINHLMSTLDPDSYIAARVVTTQLSPSGLLRMILAAFGVHTRAREKAGMLRAFEEYVRTGAAEGRRLLLIVDEVQNLPYSTLEELRMLSNLATGCQTQFQTCLVGQPQFRNTLLTARAEPLRQRIFTSYHLGELSGHEIGPYLEHRLRVASWEGDPSFDEGVFPCIHMHTDGIPRRINSLCSRLLLQAFLNESHTVSASDVHQVADEWRAEIGTVRVAGNGVYTPSEPRPAPRSAGRLADLEQRLVEQEKLLKRTLQVLERSGGVH